MPEKTKEQKSHLMLSVLVALFALLILIGIGYGTYHYGFTKGKTEMQNRYEEKLAKYAGLIPGITPKDQEVKSISGKVIKVSDESLEIEAKAPASTILELDQMKTYKVKVSSETKIYKYSMTMEIPKPEENQIFSPFKSEEIKITDLKEGDQVTVMADENIRDKDEFTAREIRLSAALGAGI